jgi:hypothetical protein
VGQPIVQKVELPAGTLGALAFPHPDYADAYRVRLPDEAPSDPEAITLAVLGTAPGWVALLMRVRDWLVGMIGLKTSEQLLRRDGRRAGPRSIDDLGIFNVFERRADELLLGENDRHLDFRVSVLVRNDSGGNWAIVSTVVRFNNWLGRAYFLPVRLFHKLIVPAMIRSACRRFSTP